MTMILFISDLYPYLYRTWDEWEVIGLYRIAVRPPSQGLLGGGCKAVQNATLGRSILSVSEIESA